MTGGRTWVKRRCRICGEPFMARASPTDVSSGRGRCCSQECGRRSRAWLASFPETVEVVALLYPRMRSPELAKFVGISDRMLERHARTYGLRKDPEWSCAGWPEDPQIRKLRALTIALKGAITRRLKEAR